MSSEALYDVVIFERATGRVETIIGKHLRHDTSFHTAEKRYETALSRINSAYDVAIVEARRYVTGEILAREEGRDA